MFKSSKINAALISIFLIQCIEAQPVKQTSTELQVRRSAADFVAAFIALDWDRFRRHFAKDASVFFPPSANFPTRADGRKAIEKVFGSVFENAKKQRSVPPYLTIEPLDMRVQMLGDVAVVTFHLKDPGIFGRRTVVFRRYDKRWLIVHLHASGVPNSI